MCAWRNSGNTSAESAAGAPERRALGLLLEGAAINQVQIEQAAYRGFRSSILRDAIRLSEPQSEADLLQVVAALVRDFEKYRSDTEAAVEARQKEWRQVCNLLMHQLAKHLNIDQESEVWTGLGVCLTSANSVDEVLSLRNALQSLFQTGAEHSAMRKAEALEEQDRSVANDNAAGLRGGGAAIEHVRAMLEKSRPGYIGLFRLSCLDVVGERFGPEGIQDCLMAVSAFLIENLRAEDKMYHWSESSLLAVCDRKIREDILSAELNRMLARNRDFTIQIGDRTIMLRIPIELQLFPITMFASADDLQKLAGNRGRGDRALSDRAIARLNS